MKIISVNVGMPQTVTWRAQPVTTGIFKRSIQGPVLVKKLNIEGDGQADLTVHGGVDKAVYAYSHDTYPWWEQKLKTPLEPGALGENLTVSSLNENDIGVGDIFRIGKCELQAVQPRQPCFKLGIKFGDLSILKTFNDFGRPGVYFRVLKEGSLRAGDKVVLIKKEIHRLTIQDLFRFYLTKTIDANLAQEALKIQSLNEQWKKKISQVLGA